MVDGCVRVVCECFGKLCLRGVSLSESYLKTKLTWSAVKSYPCFPTCTPLFIVAMRSSTLAILTCFRKSCEMAVLDDVTYIADRLTGQVFLSVLQCRPLLQRKFPVMAFRC